MKTNKTNILLLLIIAIFTFSCSSDEFETIDESDKSTSLITKASSSSSTPSYDPVLITNLDLLAINGQVLYSISINPRFEHPYNNPTDILNHYLEHNIFGNGGILPVVFSEDFDFKENNPPSYLQLYLLADFMTIANNNRMVYNDYTREIIGNTIDDEFESDNGIISTTRMN